MNRPFRLLVRHFLRRFLDNDLISPNAESQANIALFLAFLVVPNLLGSVLLVFKYGNPWTTPAERVLLGLTDKLAFLTTSMILTALVAVIEWDALWLDARDAAILRPLPIPARTLVAAKLASLGLFVSLVAALLNGVPSLLFPVIWMMTVPLGVGLILWFVAVHALTSLGAAAFAFAAVLAVRGLLVTALPRRLLQGASTVVQFGAILILVSAFLLSPAFYHEADKKVASGSRLVLAAPPMWFLGLYERLTAGAVLDKPLPRSERYWNDWTEREDSKARRAYLALEPAFAALGRRAVAGLGAVLFLALAFFAVGHVQRRDHTASLPAAGRQSRWRRRLTAALGLGLAGLHPQARATFMFTLLTFARSARHRLYAAGYLAGGIAMVVVSQGPGPPRDTPGGIGGMISPDPGRLAIQLMLVFALIIGLRVGFPIPAELRANWIFRVTEPADIRPALAGVRRAYRAVAVGFLALLVPWHAALWGWLPAIQHFAAGALISLVLADVLLAGFPKIPFTTPYVPGRSRLRYTWPLYLFSFWFVTYLAAFLEFLAMRQARSFAAFCAVLIVALVGFAWKRRVDLRRIPGLALDEEEDRAVQTLGLMD